jgi:hypothetical protein
VTLPRQRQLAARKALGRVLKAKAVEITKPIRKEHEQRLADLRKRQEQERHELRMRHSERSQADACEIKERRDRAIFHKEQQEKRMQELKENKEDIRSYCIARRYI